MWRIIIGIIGIAVTVAIIIFSVITIFRFIKEWFIKIKNYKPTKRMFCYNCRRDFEIEPLLFEEGYRRGYIRMRQIYCPYCNEYCGLDSD